MSTAGGRNDPSVVDGDAVSAPGKRFSRRKAELITSAKRSPMENLRSRERAYLIMQGMRLPFVFLSIAAALWWHNWVLAIIFFAISIPLPWISVVVANDGNEVRDKRSRNVYKPAAARQQQIMAARQQQLSSGGHSSANQPDTIDHED
ncbi:MULTISPECIES: DUF3099 domain-containing protein [unclassified Corynebacterium]|uniref:DUF3099 domain-containing protein n=1 Tax=unclassified Corynebacterium TaxID=2624378 RepID=UPI0021A9A519|nr:MULTISPECIES: DUF3099 domain-containing protein [unclassified Corynebacterium]MCT1452274.1 DUF3099 domain-containing protein [Corynebacterium sp. p3-SID1145]MCT1461330.1 DUF3099 domain-containing protein [Corynebacterium sp. p3-SID1140]MDN8593806.1 DUF3099 domain-containing protein [Corynebacterium sp. P4_F2]WKK55917.1 DUF3099 domain-containing protein [Corynebacterium sp. P4-C1]WKK63326.1 DUF3099 domain-containing protein [Corynebacterium sp. P8-C1]